MADLRKLAEAGGDIRKLLEARAITRNLMEAEAVIGILVEAGAGIRNLVPEEGVIRRPVWRPGGEVSDIMRLQGLTRRPGGMAIIRDLLEAGADIRKPGLV